MAGGARKSAKFVNADVSSDTLNAVKKWFKGVRDRSGESDTMIKQLLRGEDPKARGGKKK